jgi:hypothetical protein
MCKMWNQVLSMRTRSKMRKCGYRVLKRSVTVEYVNETYVEPYDKFLDHGVQAVISRAS